MIVPASLRVKRWRKTSQDIIQEEKLLKSVIFAVTLQTGNLPHLTQIILQLYFRNDQTTMKEHLFSHFPDICGFACIVCRKTEKRKQNLIRHLKTAHPIDVLEMLGLGDLEMYEEQFSSNSDEQINLRFIVII